MDDQRDDSQSGGETREAGEGKRLIPLLPLRDIIVFPNMVVPLFVGYDLDHAAGPLAGVFHQIAEDFFQIFPMSRKDDRVIDVDLDGEVLVAEHLAENRGDVPGRLTDRRDDA